jgi:hypothetical protein
MKIDEYVPTTTPIIMTRMKSLIAATPAQYMVTKTINVVNDVSAVLESVWFILKLMISL